MFLLLKKNVIGIIYKIKNRGIVLKYLDYDFYDLPVYRNDLEG